MKKGYKCPKCGNNYPDKLAVIIPESRSLLVLFTQQKTLSRADVQIRCSKCNQQEEAIFFRTKRVAAVNLLQEVQCISGNSSGTGAGRTNPASSSSGKRIIF